MRIALSSGRNLGEHRRVIDDSLGAHLDVVRLQFAEDRVALQPIRNEPDGSGATEWIETWCHLAVCWP
jgi:hypothetical protein